MNNKIKIRVVLISILYKILDQIENTPSLKLFKKISLKIIVPR